MIKATAFIAKAKISLTRFSIFGEKYCYAKDVPIYATGKMQKKKPIWTESRFNLYSTAASIGSIVVK